MKIAVITAMPEEYRAVIACFGTVLASRTGYFVFAGHEFVLVESGMGPDNAAKATEALLLDAVPPDLIVSAGFCGGIAPELQVGDVVVASKIIVADINGFEEIFFPLSVSGRTFVVRQADIGKRTYGGTFVSTAVLMSKRELAGVLPNRYHFPVVEMESGSIGKVAAEHNIPLLAIRTVSDSSLEELSFSLDELCDRDMRRIRLHKVLLTVLRKPYIIPQLMRLSRSSRIAAENLTNALTSLFPTL